MAATAAVAGERSPKRQARTSVLAALLLWLVTAVLVGTGLLTLRSGGTEDPSWGLPLGLAALLLGSVGALLVSRLPRHPIGRLLLVAGLLLASSTATAGLGDVGLVVHPGSIPGAVWLLWFSNVAASPAVGLLGFLALFFPTGHLPSPRWRVGVVLGILAVVLSTLQSAIGPWPTGIEPLPNPLDASGLTGGLLDVLGGAATLTGAIAFFVAAASLIARYRSAESVERQQLKWFASVALVTVPALAVSGLTTGLNAGPLGVINVVSSIIALVGAMLLPIAIGIAVLRYRLYDIDLVVRRTAVYVPLTAVLAGIYAASIALLQRLFIAATGGPSDGAVILSTLILATTFTPIKNALQGAVDRRFRDGQDAERQLQQLVDAVDAGFARPDPVRTMRSFLAVAVKVCGAMGGRAYVRDGHGERQAGAVGAEFGVPALVVSVEASHRRLGRIELDARRNGQPYSDREVAFVVAAGQHLATVTLEDGPFTGQIG